MARVPALPASRIATTLSTHSVGICAISALHVQFSHSHAAVGVTSATLPAQVICMSRLLKGKLKMSILHSFADFKCEMRFLKIVRDGVRAMFAFARRQDGGSPCGASGGRALPQKRQECHFAEQPRQAQPLPRRGHDMLLFHADLSLTSRPPNGRSACCPRDE